MTTINEAKEAVLSRFVDSWGDTTRYVFDNEKFNSGVEWVRVVVRNTGAEQETLGGVGSRKFLRRATLFVQVFVPVGEGTKNMDALSRQARDIYEGVSFSGVRFPGAGVVRETGSDGTWNRSIVEIEFQYDETK